MSSSTLASRFRTYSEVTAVAVVAFGAVALVGWITGNELLKSVLPHHVSMKANTAVALIAAGMSLRLQGRGRKPVRQRIAQGFALLTAVIGLLSFCEYAFGIDLRIDQLLFREAPGALGTYVPGRMAPTTAVSFVLIGCALLLLDWETAKSKFRPAQGLALAACAISMLAVLGYSYGVHFLYAVAYYTQMAFPTALAFVALSAGVVLARPEAGYGRWITSEGPGGVTLRRLLPVAVLLPWVTGWVSNAGLHAALYDSRAEQAYFALALICVFVVLISFNARSLDRTDQARKEAEAGLRRSRDEWELTFNCMSEGLSYHDAEFNVVRSNTAFKGLINGNAQEGLKCYQLVHGLDAPPADCPMVKTLATRRSEVSEFYEPRLDRFLSIRTDPVTNSKGEVVRVVHVVEDVTERTRAQERVLQLAAIVESSEDAIIGADLEGGVTAWNRGAERIYGFTAVEMIGKPLIVTCPSGREQETQDIIRRVKCGERVQDFETVRLRKGGLGFDASLTASPILSATGAIVGVSEIARDITERKRAEQERAALLTAEQRARRELQAKKGELDQLNRELEDRVRRRTAELLVANRELEAFSYSVSHDLRAPLRSLDGFSQILLEEYGGKLDEDGVDHLRRVRAASQHMGQLIDALLQLSRVSRADMSKDSVDLSLMAENVAADLRKSNPARQVEFVIAPELRTMGDARLLLIALQNLLGNAWKFTGKTEAAKIEFGRTEKEGQQAYFVRDNGAGFEMEFVGKLFGAFQRLHTNREFEGSGIGLATVERIVRRHGGKIWAEGETQKGATFYFTLP